jgi:hypothetical protein
MSLIARRSHADVCELLGAACNYGDEFELLIAARNHHLSMVQYLVEQRRADINTTSSHGHSALAYAALYYDDVDVPQFLLQQGIDIDKADHPNSNTALHFAAINGHINVLSLLLSHGANLYAKNSDGHLPIDLAKTEEIKQAIRDEEVRRDHRFKRIPAADLLPAPPAEASDVSDAKEEEEEEEEEESSSDEDEEED